MGDKILLSFIFLFLGLHSLGATASDLCRSQLEDIRKNLAVRPAEISLNLDSARIKGEPEATDEYAYAREALAAKYFALQTIKTGQDQQGAAIYELILMGKSAKKLVYPLAGRFSESIPDYRSDRCPDIVAKNKFSGKFSLAEAKGSQFLDAVHQLQDAVRALGGLQYIDELVIVLCRLVRCKGELTEDAFITRDKKTILGLAEAEGRLELVSKEMNAEFETKRFVPIRIVYANHLQANPKYSQ